MPAEEYFWNMCERRTGKTKEDWEDEYTKRRKTAVQQGFASEDALYTIEDYERMLAHGFHPDQFVMGRFHVDHVTAVLGSLPKKHRSDDPDQKTLFCILYKLKTGELSPTKQLL